jgi:hypothetical protein
MSTLRNQKLEIEFSYATDILKCAYSLLPKSYETFRGGQTGALSFLLYNGFEKLLKCTLLLHKKPITITHSVKKLYADLFNGVSPIDNNMLNFMEEFANKNNEVEMGRYRNLEYIDNDQFELYEYGKDMLSSAINSTVQDTIQRTATNLVNVDHANGIKTEIYISGRIPMSEISKPAISSLQDQFIGLLKPIYDKINKFHKNDKSAREFTMYGSGDIPYVMFWNFCDNVGIEMD